jgi:hypothetical protein
MSPMPGSALPCPARSTQFFRFAAAASILLLTSLAVAGPKDAAVTAKRKDAMEGDYFAMRFKQAEQKLKAALTTCGKHGCSNVVEARLHADLAVVYIAGLKKASKGKQELKLALKADPTVQVDPNFTTPEVDAAFTEAGGVKQVSETEPQEVDDDDERDRAEAAAAAAAAVPKNWLSLGFQQELMLFEATSGVCAGAAQFECFSGHSSYAGKPYEAQGDAISTGLGLATRRVLLGYERLLLGRLTLGARGGVALSGRPNSAVKIGTAFNPVHGELRASYWFGQAPFQRKGLRPFAGLSGGFGEVDAKAKVVVYQTQAAFDAGQQLQLDGWRETGGAFVSLHGGVALAFLQAHALVLELRLLAMLGDPGLAGAASLSYAAGL